MNNCKNLLFGFLGLLAFTGTMLGAKAQAAETFYVREGMALNTNSNFRRFDTQPRMSIWPRNDQDPDQLFTRTLGNKGGVLLRHQSTKMCLNAHYLSNGSEMNTWPCDANDIDQNWVIEGIGDGWNLIRRAGTNYCVDTPTRTGAGKVHLWTCDRNNWNQRWKSSNWQATIEQRIPLSEYEVWLVARKPEKGVIPGRTDAGHAWIAIIRRDYTVIRTTTGRLQSEVTVYDRGGWQADTTYGFWQNRNLVTLTEEDKSVPDFKDINKILAGQSVSSRGYAVRKRRISTAKANWLKSGESNISAGCTTYKFFLGVGTECNCADYATRRWHALMQEDFRVKAFEVPPIPIYSNAINAYFWTLDSVVDKVNNANKNGDFVDGGKVWQ